MQRSSKVRACYPNIALSYRFLAALCLAAVVAIPGAKSDDDESRVACIADACFATIDAAFQHAADGDTVVIQPGKYAQSGVLRSNGVTIIGRNVHLSGQAVEGKAALVIRGNDVTIEGLEVSDIIVPDGNGAAIRQEGTNLTLRDVYFHNNQMGILTQRDTGILTIEDSVLESNGYPGGAFGHNIYAQGKMLRFVHSKSLGARHEGHEIKSRAAKTVIEDSIIASLDSNDSRCIDVPNAGEIIIRNNLIQMGPRSTNFDVIGIGLEDVVKHEPRTAIITDNIFVLDDVFFFRLVHHEDMDAVTVQNNIIVSRANPGLGGNRWYRSREDAGLPFYPPLPWPEHVNPGQVP